LDKTARVPPSGEREAWTGMCEERFRERKRETTTTALRGRSKEPSFFDMGVEGGAVVRLYGVDGSFAYIRKER